jgi:hypothetical protein
MQGLQRTHGNRAVQRVQPQRPQGGVADWYGYGRGNSKGGYDFGGGYGTGAAESGEWWQRMGGDLPFINGSLLSWGENDDKDTRYGAKAEAGAGKLEYKGDGWSADASAFGANGEASVGTNGATFGGGLTIVGGSTTVGKFDPKSNTDTTTRFGLSAGPSFGLRTHWGDSDGDGHREIGAGFDLGIFSADLKTEDPLRSGISMTPGGQALTYLLDDKSNWTESMLGWAGGSDKPMTIDQGLKTVSDWWSN